MKGPKSLESTEKWRAMEEGFLASGEAAAVERALTQARDESVIEALESLK